MGEGIKVTWILVLLGLIAVLLIALIAAVVVVGLILEERLNRIHGALWEGLQGGSTEPYLAKLLKDVGPNKEMAAPP